MKVIWYNKDNHGEYVAILLGDKGKKYGKKFSRKYGKPMSRIIAFNECAVKIIPTEEIISDVMHKGEPYPLKRALEHACKFAETRRRVCPNEGNQTRLLNAFKEVDAFIKENESE